MREAQSLLHGLEYFPGGFRKNMKNDDWKWRAVSEEEQNIRYALERYSAMCMLSGLHSLFQEREYRDFIMVLGLYERNAIEAARKPRERGQPRVSGYEVLVCSDIQCAVSGKVEQLAKNKENSQ